MIRALILYFLSIRPTHGYDIQRFIEINGIDQWAKIQSGSIYYALGKMEKEGFIHVLREEKNGARIRKIYAINDSGNEELKRILKDELLSPLITVESDKFIIHSFLNRLSKEEIKIKVEEQIKLLKEKKQWWVGGKRLKITDNSLKIEILNFDMVISNLEYQIKWHEALLEEVDKVIIGADKIEKIIKNVDFASLDDVNYKDIGCSDLKAIEQIKNDILKNPEDLEHKIDRLIELLKQ